MDKDNKIEIKEWFDDYDLLKSFLSKEVLIFDKKHQNEVIITLPTIQDFLLHPELSSCLSIFKQPIKELIKGFDYWSPKTYLDFFKLIFFELSTIQEFQFLYKNFIFFINFIFQKDQITFNEDNWEIFINDINLSDSLWNYIWYIIWTSFGDKRERPRIFDNEVDEHFYQIQKDNEERIRQIRSRGTNIDRQDNHDQNQLLSIFSVIMYSFKQLNFDFLFNCTNAQINWLYQQAHKISNYEVEAKAFAAGNMKKKLKFFTEK